MKNISLFALAFGIIAIYIHRNYKFAYNISYPKDSVSDFILKNVNFKNQNKKQPLNGLSFLITGATSGIGQELATELFSYGATVIIACRNSKRGASTVEKIIKEYPDSSGKLIIENLDTSDLNNVHSFITRFKKTYNSLHYLVNNAGINYISDGIISGLIKDDSNYVSKHGYDLAFVTNYLGHYLIATELADLIHESAKSFNELSIKPFYGKILSIASAYHYQSDGSMLVTTYNNETGKYSTPFAARGDINTIFHRKLSYGNDKLAQVLFTKEFQKRLFNTVHGNLVKVVSVCPGWVYSPMVPVALRPFAFPTKTGILSSISALLDNEILGGGFATNYWDFYTTQTWTPIMLNAFNMLGLRDTFVEILIVQTLFAQAISYDYYPNHPTSPESLDSKLANNLFEWSKQVTGTFRK